MNKFKSKKVPGIKYKSVSPKKWPHPLIKRLSKIYAEWQRIEEDYEKRYDEWFKGNTKDKPLPLPKKPVIRMERLLKLVLSIARRLKIDPDKLPDLSPKKGKKSKLVTPEEISMIQTPTKEELEKFPKHKGW